jgi:two-component system sensor histidine kinase KdpD
LIALRELALRRTADRIDGDVRAYRVEQSIDTIWKTGAALLACVGPRADSEHLVRSSARLAGQLGTSWHAVYIETPALQRLPAAQRERILTTLKLAQDLGATTAVIAGSDIAAAAIDYARTHNLSKIALGRAHRTWPWRRAHIQRIAGGAPDIDLIEMGEAAHRDAPPPVRMEHTLQARHIRGYAWAALASMATALVATPLLAYLDLANIAMLFLLVVVLVAVRFGRGPSVVATCVSVACFDFFFVPPRFTFAISDFQYGITFVVMLVVGLITGHLTAGLRFQARVAAQREGRARALYEFARELSGALQTEQIFDTTRAVVQRAFRAEATLLVPDGDGRLQLPADAAALDIGIAQWAFDHATSAGLGTDTLPASSVFYLPLVAPMRTRGILAITPGQPRWMLIPEQRQQLDTFAALAAIALERVHYIEVAQDALVNMESERLRNALLAALSHDLRTPLTSLVGLSETLAASKPPLAPVQQSMACALHDEARRMSTLVTNLLDMARIQSGEVTFNLQWQDVEEVVGSALRISAPVLHDHVVATDLAPGLPLLHVDAVLIERVLCNLLENAAKYTPPGSRIVVAAQVHGAWVQLTVSDNGPGLPAGKEEHLFEKFTRGERESNKPGVGLGLAICRAIVEAHGGTIRAAASPEGGAAFIVSLPRGTPPAPPMENLDE